MKITKDTKVCISIAERPGNFGTTVLNTAFQALNLDYIYKPFRVLPKNLEAAIQGIRAFGISGCGVSMPHKREVMKYLNKIDEAAQRIGAVNTLVNDQGVLTGYNTDFEGARRAFEEMYEVRGKKVLVVGAGGVARAILLALKELGASEIWLTNRDEEKGKALAKEFSLHYTPFDQRTARKAHLLVNATSVGMPPHIEETVMEADALANFEAGLDVVVSPQKTRLIQTLEALKIKAIPGFKMALYQGVAQCKLYTGVDAPEALIEEAIRSYFQDS